MSKYGEPLVLVSKERHNLRRNFGLDTKAADAQTRIMVVDVGTTVGLVADSVSEVLRLPADTVEPPRPMTGGAGAEFIRGTGKLQDSALDTARHR